MISLADPVLCEEEKAALCSVIESGWLTMGERVAAFERAFAELHGAENAVAVNSCTAGLHLCLAALGIGPGDEVLAPALTFVATINAILYVGAAPVFVDIETEDLPHISLRDAEAKRTPKTRAAMIMHYGGYMADTVGWRSFCDAHRLKLIEDAAHAPAVKGVARLGDASAFSFFTNKNMTTAEGGMVLAGDPEVLEKTRRMRSHGMTTGTLDRHRGHAYSYDVTVIGYNYRMDELRAAMGLVQLARLPGWNARRRELSSLYRRRFSERLPQVSIPFSDEHESAAHLMPVLLPQRADREQIMVKLREAAIQSSIHYPPVHGFSYFRRRFPGVTLPNTDKFSSRELTLPLHPSLSDDDVDFVVQTLKKAIER
ncbi:MAG: DegT/DnrJ/EryC1/StrS aminotransferase family protein [Syntrophobacteraceae bacterium]